MQISAGVLCSRHLACLAYRAASKSSLMAQTVYPKPWPKRLTAPIPDARRTQSPSTGTEHRGQGDRHRPKSPIGRTPRSNPATYTDVMGVDSADLCCPTARCQGCAAMQAWAFFVQRQGRALRGVQGRTASGADRDAVSARRVCAPATYATASATTARPCEIRYKGAKSIARGAQHGRSKRALALF